MPEFNLVNPVIQGKMSTTFSGKNSLEAANKAYSALSENFNNNIPKFLFTLQEKKSNVAIGGGKVSDYKHYEVTEKKTGNKVNFRIVEYKPKNNDKEFKNFKANLKKQIKQNQDGGKKKKKDDDSSSSSESEDYKIPKTKTSVSYTVPISTWWYDPYVYRLEAPYYYLPTYVAPLSPYVSIPLPLY